ncbi:MAG: nucleotide sugar dehydrogenase [Candidatus Moraniibacteriota bacterium]|nr:MAG: nucleotide sugar dehydrogenase [Candidatus Moranbacteria bacterium]
MNTNEERTKQETVCVVGLGYVGLPLAVRARERGYRVIGFDVNEERNALINDGKSPIEDQYLEAKLPKYRFEATNNPERIREADILLICVPTPVDELHNPDLTPVENASQTVAKNLKKGALVVLESTVNPGVSEEIIAPLFEKEGHTIGHDVFLAHCPERINPGDDVWNVTNIPRVVGAFDAEGLARAVRFYESIVDGEIRPMKSIREAEAVKVVENSFRDINIAFVNELARSFDCLDIDVADVIRGASTKPFSFMPHFPSCGVGGHCIPVDPYYLIERAKRAGFDHKFLRLAREINNGMPEYTVELLQDALNEVGLPLNKTGVGVLGLSYKANIDDLRESPSLEIIKHLKRHRATVHVFDPHIKDQSTVSSLEALLEASTALILATNHREFLSELPPEILKKHGILVFIDGKNAFDKKAYQEAGIVYKGIGR